MDSAKVDMLKSALQAYAWRTQAAAANLANLDSPGYNKTSISFEEEMQRVLQSRGKRLPGDVKPEIVVEQGPPILEDELMDLADTQMRTQMATRALRGFFNTMRTSISGRTG